MGWQEELLVDLSWPLHSDIGLGEDWRVLEKVKTHSDHRYLQVRLRLP